MARSLCFRALVVALAGVPLQIAVETASHEGVFDELVAWMQKGIDKWVPQEHQTGLEPLRDMLATRDRTFIAKRDLQKDQLLMRFPRECLMHAGYFLGDDAPLATLLSKALEEKIVHIAPQTWLALYMLEQRRLGAKSFWHPYLKLLPSEFPGNPIFYAEKDFAWLKGSTFIPRAKAHLEMLTQQYETLSQLVPEFSKSFSLEDFLWARSAIATRVFGWHLPGLPQENTDFMVPMGDMFNHRSPKQLEWIYNETTGTFDYWVKEDVAAGGELFISYGTKSNAEYLLHYGFAVADLPKRNYSVCSVRVALGLNGVPDQEAKRKWLIKASFSPVTEHEPAEFTLRDTWEKEPDKMLAHARLLELSDMKEVEHQILPGMKNCKRIAQPPLCPKPVSIPNEQAALKRCLRVIRESLQAYPTTLEEDERLLPTLEGLPASLVTLRKDEKVVLRWWERFFDLALDAFDQPAGSIERRCNEVLGESRCSVESNYYMRTTLYELLGGDSAADSGVLGSAVTWVIVAVMAAAVAWWRNVSQRQSPGFTGCRSVASVPSGRKAKRR